MGHLTLFPKVADLDGFYHIGHAAAYLEGSIFNTALPWATQSVIADRGADMWWGFHMVLMPFAAIGDVAIGIRLAALFLTSVLALVVFWILRRHGVAGPGWWAALFLIAVPNLFFRHLMVRPHMLSLAASLALLSVLVRGRWWQALWLSAAITWLHLSLFWMAPGIVGAYTLIRLAEHLLHGPRDHAGVGMAAAVASVTLGTVIGWLLRPHAMQAGALANVQIIRLFAQKTTAEPLLFAAELQPIPVSDLLLTSWLFAVAWIVACVGLVWFIRRGGFSKLAAEEQTLLLTALIISVPFLLLALLSARRAMMQWVAFGFLLIPILWTVGVNDALKRRVRVWVGVLLAAHVLWGAQRHLLNVDLVAFRADTMEGIAGYLKENGEPGEVVFHARWDNFGPLFAYNRSSLYLGGMDPIFQFVHSPERYWEFFYLSADINLEWTCDAFPCASGRATDTHTVLREHFGARWVVVEPFRNPRLTLYLLNDPRYTLAFETQHEALFEILSTPAEVAPRRSGNLPAPSDAEPTGPLQTPAAGPESRADTAGVS